MAFIASLIKRVSSIRHIFAYHLTYKCMHLLTRVCSTFPLFLHLLNLYFDSSHTTAWGIKKKQASASCGSPIIICNSAKLPSECKTRAERLVVLVGRVEGLATGRLIYEAYSLVPNVFTRSRSMWNGVASQNDALVTPRNTKQSENRQNLLLPTGNSPLGSGDPKDSKLW